MAGPDLLQIAICLALIMLLAVPLSRYLSAVYQGRARWLVPVERGFYRLCGIDPQADQHWTRYAAAMLVLNGAGLLLLYAALRLQGYLPLNPQHLPGVSPALAFNTAVSFTSNTNWQAYGGETTMSYFSQMLGLTVQNFLSAGTGMAVAVAVIRGFSRRSAEGIGNFYVDLTRSILYVLLPLALIGALFLAWQGVPQNFHHYVQAATLNGGHQTLAQGPAASQVAIKQLGTNGGGFFNVNSAHPYENPTPLTNLLETVFILLIPVALVLAFGRLVGDRRQGWALFAAMAVMFLIGLGVLYASEHAGNPALAQLPVDTSAGNMVGKEVRIGVGNSALWAAATTAASNGSVNAMMDSLTPLGGLAALANILTGEVVFGGVGTGLYGMILFVVITVFLAGLMVGRTPEYLGKKIESREVTLSLLALLTMPVGVIGLGALGCLPAGGRRRHHRAGPPRPEPVGLRLRLGHRQQRLRLRRLPSQQLLQQHPAGPGHVAGALRRDHSHAGRGRRAGREEGRTALGRHLPHPWPAVRGPADRRGADRGRADLLPHPGPGAYRRTSGAGCALREAA